MRVSVKFKNKAQREVFPDVKEVREHEAGHLVLIPAHNTNAEIIVLADQWSSRERVSSQ